MYIAASSALPVKATEAGEKRLNIITGEWSPYVSPFNSWPGATRHDAYGVATEILAIALRQCGLAAQFRFRSWEDVLEVADAQAGLAFPFRYSQQRAEHV